MNVHRAAASAAEGNSMSLPHRRSPACLALLRRDLVARAVCVVFAGGLLAMLVHAQDSPRLSPASLATPSAPPKLSTPLPPLVPPAAVKSEAGEKQPSIGHLVVQNRSEDGIWYQTSEPYVPHEGDILFFNDHSVKWGWLYWMVGSDAPYHAGLVYKKPDGTCGCVEAGPNDTFYCRTLELSNRLHDWPDLLQIRRCKKQLTPEKSAEMTKWAQDQHLKPYAIWRLLLQATPVRARGTVRKTLFGATYTDRSRFLCAELVIAGGTVGGIFDPHIHKGNTIYPRDIIFNDVYDLAPIYHDAQVWIPSPIAPRDPRPRDPREARDLSPTAYGRR
jgi:hypothetical protein